MKILQSPGEDAACGQLTDGSRSEIMRGEVGKAALTGSKRRRYCSTFWGWISMVSHQHSTVAQGKPARPKSASNENHGTSMEYPYVLSTTEDIFDV